MGNEDRELLTLTEVSERTGISMPTLGKYKKAYADRIPSVGEGRTQRYPVEALEVFEEIKQENLKKRGRPAKSEKKSSSNELLPLTKIAERTGISYPTLRRYAQEHEDEIPSEGEGRKRRYHPEAIEVFKRIYGDGKPGPAKKKVRPRKREVSDASLAQRVQALERSQEKLLEKTDAILKQLKEPIKVKVSR